MTKPPENRGLELTLRGILLGAVITLVFTAANVYLGLKVGLTFATSIPAAVISMALLRYLRNATIWENNIVQTVASAAGTLSSVIFVLPGLVMVGWWTHFPYWQSFGICAAGGILGVMYSVPLRRALVTQSDLPYPEGVAAAEVLKVGTASRTGEAAEENRAGLFALLWGSIASAAFAAVVATNIFAGQFDRYFRVESATTGSSLGLSLALLGAGHLIGLTVGIAMFVGLLIAYGLGVPVFSILHPMAGDALTVANAIRADYVRFLGVGVIGVAAIWTIGTLAAPVWNGVASALQASRRNLAAGEDGLPITERDLPIKLVALISLFCFLPIAVLLWLFLSGGLLSSLIVPLVIAGIIYIFVAGFLVAAACGYMAGLIGSSNSPVSGLAILSVIGASLLLVLFAKNASVAAGPSLVAFALFVTAVLINVATISNDNLQDLKTGQLVNATPWRQQVALIIGTIFGALVIPPFLDLLNGAYGFGGLHGLPAPQATLISTLAKGVIQGFDKWYLIGIGALLGALIVIIDEVLKRTTRFRLPPLAVGLGIYLPAVTTAAAVVGAFAGALYNRWVDRKPNAPAARRLGVLIASGLIVGESLFGVLLAGLIVALKNPSPLGIPFVGPAFAPWAALLGLLFFILIPILLYRYSARHAAELKNVSA
ncbi:MAG: oligopeptide transporter, OPT family [Candidatus Eremiobacter antarcticus]|nr:MAG: oligopeptide transporter, OPT family [Candidatus Eremiobacteraeota bacterium]PZR64377.1 MAG: oligopeptide transporter, OPT family [Candidatus Eremiobacter sp. RRmetagenome_bin22]